MLIFKTVLVKKLIKTILILLIFAFYPISFVNASDPSFSFYPAGGVVANKDEGFTVDVMIDSGSQELVSARFVVTFDPRYLQLTKAERNNSLFAQWPEDESTLDNTNGVVMLTGFSQSGTEEPYVTDGSADVIARLTFDVIKSGQTTLNWEFNGTNSSFKSIMLKDGSPPQNILVTTPKAATFVVGKVINTGLSWDKYVLIGGFVMILFGGMMIFSRPRTFGKRRGTIIEYEE